MGPQLLSAELFRPIDFTRIPTAELIAREPSARFQTYLDDTEPARETPTDELPDETDESAETEDTAPAEVAADQPDTEENSQSRQPVPAVIEGPAQETSSQPSMRVDETPVTEKPAVAKEPHHASSNAAQSLPVRDAAGAELEAEAAVEHKPRAPAPAQTQPHRAHVEGDKVAGPQISRNERAASERSQSSAEQPKSDQEAPERTPKTIVRSPEAPVHLTRPKLPIFVEPKTAFEITEPRESGHEQGARSSSGGESVFERKVRLSVEQRRQGSTDNAKPGGRHARGAGDKHSSGADDTTRTAARVDETDVASLPKPPSLRTGQGDGAAAALARFLVSGPQEGNAATGSRTIGSVSHQSGATPAQVASYGTTSLTQIGDLLVSQSAGADAIEPAARVLNATGGAGRFQVTMQLEPPDLGALRVQVRMAQRGMTLSVDTQSTAVARLVESRLSELRDALAAHGIRIDRADVVVRTPESGQTDSQQQSRQEQSLDQRSAQDASHTGGGGAAGSNWSAEDRDEPANSFGDSASVHMDEEQGISPSGEETEMVNILRSRVAVDLVA